VDRSRAIPALKKPYTADIAPPCRLILARKGGRNDIIAYHHFTCLVISSAEKQAKKPHQSGVAF